MTEGIIQKVFSEARKEHPQVFAHSVWFDELEQELIEEIKKALDLPTGNKELDNYVIQNADIEVIKLIGDNQE